MVRSTEPEGEHALDVSVRMETRSVGVVRMWEIIQKQIMWALLLLLECGKSQWLYSSTLAVQNSNERRNKERATVERVASLPPE